VLATLGIPLASDDAGYQLCLRLADRYRRRRASEIVKAHGWMSAGAASILATSALQLALSRYYAARGTDEKLAALASKLGNDSRQNELAAWELAAREAKARVDDDEDDLWAPSDDEEEEEAEEDDDADDGDDEEDD
jgi:hypothetical protein